MNKDLKFNVKLLGDKVVKTIDMKELLKLPKSECSRIFDFILELNNSGINNVLFEKFDNYDGVVMYKKEGEDIISVYEYDSLSDKFKEFLIKELDFKLKINKKNKNGIYSLKDMQNANYGDIESERFQTLDEVIDRLSNYFPDYNIEFL